MSAEAGGPLRGAPRGVERAEEAPRAVRCCRAALECAVLLRSVLRCLAARTNTRPNTSVASCTCSFLSDGQDGTVRRSTMAFASFLLSFLSMAR